MARPYDVAVSFAGPAGRAIAVDLERRLSIRGFRVFVDDTSGAVTNGRRGGSDPIYTRQNSLVVVVVVTSDYGRTDGSEKEWSVIGNRCDFGSNVYYLMDGIDGQRRMQDLNVPIAKMIPLPGDTDGWAVVGREIGDRVASARSSRRRTQLVSRGVGALVTVVGAVTGIWVAVRDFELLQPGLCGVEDYEQLHVIAEKGEWELLEATSNDMSVSCPNDSVPRYYNGEANLKLGRLDRAIRSLTSAIDVGEPRGRHVRMVDYYDTLGVSLQETLNFEGARDAFDHAFQVDPLRVSVRLNRANNLMMTRDVRDLTEAEQVYRSLLENNDAEIAFAASLGVGEVLLTRAASMTCGASTSEVVATTTHAIPYIDKALSLDRPLLEDYLTQVRIAAAGGPPEMRVRGTGHFGPGVRHLAGVLQVLWGCQATRDVLARCAELEYRDDDQR